MPKRNCQHCGCTFNRRGSRPAKFCSRACYDATRVSTFDLRQWYESNREKQNAKRNEWRLANREKRLDIQKRWRLNNLEAIAASGGMRRKAQKAGVPKKAVDMVLSVANGHCTYCGLRSDKLELDHVIPLSLGGKHALNNFLPACRSCNASKSNKDAAEWLFEKHGVLGLARAVFMLENRKNVKAAS